MQTHEAQGIRVTRTTPELSVSELYKGTIIIGADCLAQKISLIPVDKRKFTRLLFVSRYYTGRDDCVLLRHIESHYPV